MDPVDYSCREHAEAITKILELLRWPHHCRLTGRTKDALIKLRLSNGQLFAAAAAHLTAQLPLYCEMQTMYDAEPTQGYVICPLLIRGERLYCKMFLPKVSRECDECLVISAHPPERPCPGEKK